MSRFSKCRIPSGAILSVLLALVAGCSASNAPRLETWTGEAWTTLAISALEISGRREGAETNASVDLVTEDGRRIQMQLKVSYNPTPVLAAGRWQCDDESGDIVAETLKFLGGQAEGPSLGGRFRLEVSGTPRFRVTIPLTLLTN